MKILIADFETTPFRDDAKRDYVLEPRFIQIYNKKNKKFKDFVFEDNPVGYCKFARYIELLCDRREPSKIIFHNVKFDYQFLFQFIPKKFKQRLVINGGRFIMIELYIIERSKTGFRRRVLLKIVDSYNILLTSVEKLGIKFNFPKQKVDYSMPEITAEYIAYGQQDCLIVDRALTDLCEIIFKLFKIRFTIETLPPTIASLSKKLWLKLITQIKGKKYVNNIFLSDEDIEEFMRGYYFGGRVEAFDFNLLLNGFYNDYNSAYPYIMVKYLFPMGYYKIQPTRDTWNDIKHDKYIFGCECEVYENQFIPLVPIRMNDKILFPNGTKKCFLFREEIEYMLEMNQKVKILQIAYCSDYQPIFKDYVNTCYTLRKKAKIRINNIGVWNKIVEDGKDIFERDIIDALTLEYFLKIFMNSLYGKFAESEDKEEKHIIANEQIDILNLPEGQKMEPIPNNRKLLTKCSKVPVKSNIIFAMYITAMQRMKLHKDLLKARKMGKLYYTDTDSIVSKFMLDNSEELGRLKPELANIMFQALGCKEYITQLRDKKKAYYCPNCKKILKKKQIEDKLCVKCGSSLEERLVDDILVKMKGFGRLEPESFDEFVSDYFEEKPNTRLVGFLEAFHRELELGTMLVFTKQKQSVFDKRWILKDLTTRPFNIDHDSLPDLIKNNKVRINGIISNYTTKTNRSKIKCLSM